MLKFGVRPYFLQPYSFRAYFGLKKQQWPKQIKREFYISFEDALWDLLPKFGYKSGATILVPTFYCVDVIENMRNHGYNVVEYTVSDELSINRKVLLDAINIYSPQLVVVFDTDGIPQLSPTEIMPFLPSNTLLISDKVHSIPFAEESFYPINEKHLILTSLRKVTPLFGSVAVYKSSVQFAPSLSRFPVLYSIGAILLWIRYLLLLKLAVMVKSVSLAKKAENYLKRHDDLIGDALYSHAMPKVLLEGIDHIAIESIRACKKRQVAIYKKVLEAADLIKHTMEYASELRGFPIILDAGIADKIIEYCRRNGFLVVSQLDDSTWAKDKKLLFLPLGPHLTENDIEKIANITKKALTLGA